MYKQFCKENPEDERATSYYALCTSIAEQMEKDGFFKRTGMEDILENMESLVKSKQKKQPRNRWIISGEANQSAESSNGAESGGQRKRFSELIWEEFLPKALLYGCPYDLFWHLNPTKLTAFRKAYEERLQQKEDAMWRNGLYTMRAINACFGGKYPEKPLFEVGESKESSERQEHDGYTEQEIKEAREALVMQLQIMEGQQRRAKRKKELFDH